MTPCSSRKVQVFGTSTRRHAIGLMPSSQTLICTMTSGSDGASAVSVRGLVRFGERVTQLAYRLSRRGHPTNPDALPIWAQ